MNISQLIEELQKRVGVKIPEGTIRRWAHEGLIPGPKSAGKAGKGGCYYDWSKSLEYAAAICALRNRDAKIPWAQPIKDRSRVTTERLKAAKKIVDRFYTAIDEFCETGDPADIPLRKPGGLLKPGKPPFSTERPKDSKRKQAWLGGTDLAPLIVRWIATVEQIRHNKALSPINVVFNFPKYLVNQQGKKSFKWQYEGVTFNPSDRYSVTVNPYMPPEEIAKLLGGKPTDWEQERQRRSFLTLNKNGVNYKGRRFDWNSVDFSNNQIIIKDHQRKEVIIVRYVGNVKTPDTAPGEDAATDQTHLKQLDGVLQSDQEKKPLRDP